MRFPGCFRNESLTASTRFGKVHTVFSNIIPSIPLWFYSINHKVPWSMGTIIRRVMSLIKKIKSFLFERHYIETILASLLCFWIFVFNSEVILVCLIVMHRINDDSWLFYSGFSIWEIFISLSFFSLWHIFLYLILLWSYIWFESIIDILIKIRR